MASDFKKRRTLRSPTYKNEDGHITEEDKNDKEDEGMDQVSDDLISKGTTHKQLHVTWTCQSTSLASLDPTIIKESSLAKKSC